MVWTRSDVLPTQQMQCVVADYVHCPNGAGHDFFCLEREALSCAKRKECVSEWVASSKHLTNPSWQVACKFDS
jgi:hypothetical protein